jgi:hypothetical protein
MLEDFQPNKRQKTMTDRRFQQVSIVNPNFNYEEWIKYPEPNDVPEFLENPYKFCPKEEWITSTTVEVSSSFLLIIFR